MKKDGIYVADFETCATNTDNTEARVWAYCIMDVMSKEVVALGGSIDGFMSDLSNIVGKIYFHNLKFDGSFIVPWLLNNKFKQLTHIETEKRRYKKNSFEFVADEMNNVYGINIYWGYNLLYPKNATKTNPFRKPSKKWFKTTILDSYKLLPMSVSNMATKFLELPYKEQKGSIDYVKIRPTGYEITEEEKEYIINDCLIVCKGIEKMVEKGLVKSTISSCALHEFIKLTFDGNKEKFRRVFPVLLEKYDEKKVKIIEDNKTKEIIDSGRKRNYDDFCREAYKGGWTYLNPKYKNIRHKEVGGVTFDVNSLYPSVMLNNLMPFGEPLKFDGKYKKDKKYPLYIQEIYISRFYLKPNKFPIIQIKNSSRFNETEYLENGECVKICVTNIDLEMIQDSYNLHGVKYCGGLKFMAIKGVFNNYINYFSTMKIQATKEGNKTLRELAKLLLNSLYGKFASKVDRYTMVPYFDKNGVVRNLKNIKDSYVVEPIYTAVGVFITSYARRVTITAANANYDTFMYADTDSIHLNITENEIDNLTIPMDLDNTGELGLWKLELIFTDSLYLGAKKYMEKNILNDSWEVKCAGLPKEVRNIIVDKSQFYVGATFKGKKTRRVVKGGTLIVLGEFTIKK